MTTFVTASVTRHYVHKDHTKASLSKASSTNTYGIAQKINPFFSLTLILSKTKVDKGTNGTFILFNN